MAQISVIQFASELGLPPALLLEQLQAAGVKREPGEETGHRNLRKQVTMDVSL